MRSCSACWSATRNPPGDFLDDVAIVNLDEVPGPSASRGVAPRSKRSGTEGAGAGRLRGARRRLEPETGPRPEAGRSAPSAAARVAPLAAFCAPIRPVRGADRGGRPPNARKIPSRPAGRSGVVPPRSADARRRASRRRSAARSPAPSTSARRPPRNRGTALRFSSDERSRPRGSGLSADGGRSPGTGRAPGGCDTPRRPPAAAPGRGSPVRSGRNAGPTKPRLRREARRTRLSVIAELSERTGSRRLQNSAPNSASSRSAPDFRAPRSRSLSRRRSAAA